jgi:hypothetical protein
MALTKVTSNVVGDEFTTSATIAQAGGDLDFKSAQVFTLTYPTSGPNTTINIVNPVVGVQKTLVVVGAGNTPIDIAFTVGGSAGTFNKIAGDYDDTLDTKNLFSILCYSPTEFWYSISQIAT